MSHVFVVKPGEEHKLPQVAAIAQRLKDQILSIEQLGDEAKCRICAERPADTAEHVPSKSAGNRNRVLQGHVDSQRSIASGFLSWNVRHVQRVVFQTLCARCNNNTGSWYNPAYVIFSKYCESLALPQAAGLVCEVRVRVNAQRLLKQALASLIAVSQPGLTVKYPQLRELVISRDVASALSPCHLWLYLRANKGSRCSGLGSRIEFSSGVGQLLAEFSSWPLGWLLTLDDILVPGAVDASDWSLAGYSEVKELALPVPCQWAVSPYPADFRSAEEIKKGR